MTVMYNQSFGPAASYDLAGRIALVTGGLNGIGASIVSMLRAARARTIIWDNARSDDPDHVQVDITDRTAIRSQMESLQRLDIVVNSAGYAGATVPLEEYPPDEWRRVVEINLLGTFNLCQAAVPLLRRGGWGRVLNIASLAGKEGTPNASAYSAAKAGVIALTKSLGKELAGTGILVNAVAPAAVRTRLLEQMTPEHVKVMIDKSPLKRLIEPEEVAELALWLCSDACTANTGAIFDLSAGRATY